jgi:hypothetical protein
VAKWFRYLDTARSKPKMPIAGTPERRGQSALALLCSALLVGGASGRALAPHVVEYVPSAVEARWLQLLTRIDPHDCSAWEPGSALRAAIVDDAARLGWNNSGPVPASDLSTFRYVDSFGRSETSAIEPLVGSLRHHMLGADPRTTNRNVLMAKDHFSFDKAGLQRALRNGGRLLFFDIGASLYASGAGGDGGASQMWFTHMYSRLSGRAVPSFDRIWAWEAKPYNPPTLWGSFPPELVPVLHYYNVPATTEFGSKMNPWQVLLATARRDDYVVVKLDVDHQPTELSLVRQLLADGSISSLIDDFFWEHHVAGSMVACPRAWHSKTGSGWSTMRFNLTAGSLESLLESYQLFTRLRKAGIRAHSWV